MQRPFLAEIAGSLGIDASRTACRTKDDIVARLVAYTSEGDPYRYKSAGGTVTNEALLTILQGIKDRHLTDVSLTNGAAAARIALAEYICTKEEGLFEELNLTAERLAALPGGPYHEDRPHFQRVVFNAYGGRCAITSCDVPEALRSAYIHPTGGTRRQQVTNGVLLRADLHQLWSTGLIAVDESTYQIRVAAHLLMSDYAQMRETFMRLPAKNEQAPSSQALTAHRRWAAL